MIDSLTRVEISLPPLPVCISLSQKKDAFPEVQESLSFIDLKLLKKTFIIKRSTFLLFHPVGAPGSSLNLG